MKRINHTSQAHHLAKEALAQTRSHSYHGGKEPKCLYTSPELKEHGSAKDVTLQTFFGSFSP